MNQSSKRAVVPASHPGESGYYEPYSSYHRSLRLWFLAYGIGAPVFLVQFPGAIDALKNAGSLRPVTGLFLAGVVVQVAAALIYKTAMWYLYMEELRELPHDSKRVKVSSWLSSEYWLEALFDGITLFLFAVATWRVIASLT
jgi:hypothetical protein